MLALRAGFNADRQLAWFDRSGQRLAGLDAHEPYLSPRLSPGGGQIALIRPETPIGQGLGQSGLQTRSICLLDLALRSVSPFAFGAVASPVWSADGNRIVFGRGEAGDHGLYWKAVGGGGDEELLLRTAHPSTPLSWSPDGRFILFREEQGPGTGAALFVLPVLGQRKPILISQLAPYGGFSPDGRWIAYAWGKSGRYEVWVRSFDESDPGAAQHKWQVTEKGGFLPRWRRDGRELFYWDLYRRLVAVPVSTGSAFKAGAPVTLFDTHDHDPTDFDYDVSADGQRFLVSRLVQDDSRPVNIALDWLAVAKKRD